MAKKKKGERAVYEVTFRRTIEVSCTVEVEAHDEDEDEARQLGRIEADNSRHWIEGHVVDEDPPRVKRTSEPPTGRAVTANRRSTP